MGGVLTSRTSNKVNQNYFWKVPIGGKPIADPPRDNLTPQMSNFERNHRFEGRHFPVMDMLFRSYGNGVYFSSVFHTLYQNDRMRSLIFTYRAWTISEKALFWMGCGLLGGIYYAQVRGPRRRGILERNAVEITTYEVKGVPSGSKQFGLEHPDLRRSTDMVHPSQAATPFQSGVTGASRESRRKARDFEDVWNPYASKVQTLPGYMHTMVLKQPTAVTFPFHYMEVRTWQDIRFINKWFRSAVFAEKEKELKSVANVRRSTFDLVVDDSQRRSV